MAPLKHREGPAVTVGGMSKRPPEERDGRSKARGPGAGRPRKDGSPAVPVPAELRALRGRDGTVPKVVTRGPPSEAEQAAWVAKWAPDGNLPDDKLSPREVYEQAMRPILPFDEGLALEICDRLENSQTVAWMVRNWAGFPGTRTWLSWSQSEEIKAALRHRLEQRGVSTLLAAQAEVGEAPRVIMEERVDPKAAGAFAAAVKTKGEMALKIAGALSPERFGQQLNVKAESTVRHEHGLTSGAAELLARFRETSRALSGPVVIEGEVAE